jgi:hypothetical protein
MRRLARGVRGFSDTGVAVSGVTRTGWAGEFLGDVIVRGRHIVTGRKSAAVQHPDGSTRLLFCMEGPQPRFEDVGRAQLVEGRAAVALDPDFAPLVQLIDYHVFLTPEGDCNGLFVSDRGPHGFEVRELAGGTGTLPFNYRLIASRRETPADRLPTIELPQPVNVRDLDDVETPMTNMSSMEMPLVPEPPDRIPSPPEAPAAVSPDDTTR